MFTAELATADAAVRLVRPDVERDALRSVTWLAGESGKATLELMGVPSEQIHESTLEEERQRIKGFLEENDELDWMIRLNGETVGAIWVNLKPGRELRGPALSLMIGDPVTRGHGVGRKAMVAVMRWLQEERREPVIYARHLVDNAVSSGLLRSLGFTDDGAPYTGADGLSWQNVRYVNLGQH